MRLRNVFRMSEGSLEVVRRVERSGKHSKINSKKVRVLIVFLL